MRFTLSLSLLNIVYVRGHVGTTTETTHFFGLLMHIFEGGIMGVGASMCVKNRICQCDVCIFDKNISVCVCVKVISAYGRACL